MNIIKQNNLRFRSKNWRIVIPNLEQYKLASPTELQQLKFQVLQKVLSKQKKNQLQHYCIALQRHQNDTPHLDILLLYPKSVKFNFNHFDYILKHGNITTYRNLNQAILDYGKKQDPSPLTNLPEDSSTIISIQQLKKDPYRYLELQMLKDPIHFNLQEYVRINDLAQYISNWSSIKLKLKDMQTAAANLRLKKKSWISTYLQSLC